MRLILSLAAVLALAPLAEAGGGFGQARVRQRSVIRQRGQFRAQPALAVSVNSYAQPAAFVQYQPVQQLAIQPVLAQPVVQYQVQQQVVRQRVIQQQFLQQDYCAPQLQLGGGGYGY